MLKIIIDSNEIDLGGLSGISLNYNPGIFELGSFDGSYAIPFTIPATPKNNKIIGFAHKINSPSKEIREFEAEIWHSGIQILTGTLKATEFTEDEISCNLYIDNGKSFKAINQKNLPENDYGGYKAFVEKNIWDPNTDDYVIYPVVNTGFYLNTVYEPLINSEETAGFRTQNLYENGILIYKYMELPLVSFQITPFPLLWRVLEYLFKGIGYVYTDNFFSVGTMKNINIFNINSAVEGEILLVFGERILYSYITRVNIANHLPDIPTSDFIKAIQAFFNICFYVQKQNVTVLDRLALIQSSDYDDLTSKLLDNYKKTLTGSGLSGVSILFTRDTGDANIADLPVIDELKNITETETDPELIDAPEQHQVVIWNSTYAAYYQFMNFMDIYPESESDIWEWFGYHPDYRGSATHENYCAQMSFMLGDKDIEINADLGTVPEHIFSDPGNGYDNYYPKLIQQGNSTNHKDTTPFTLRLMQYCGLQSVEGETVPLGCYKNGDMSITAYWSYYNRWKEFLAWYTEAVKEEFEMQIQFSASEIKNFDFSRKKLINGNLYFITNMEVQLTRTSINPATCKLLKAN